MTNASQNIRAWSVGLDMVYSAAGMLLLGALIDWLAGTRPWWMLGLGLLGLVVGMVRFIRDAMRMNAASSGPRRTTPGTRSTNTDQKTTTNPGSGASD